MDNIRIGKILENKYYIILNGEAQAFAYILSENTNYYVSFDFQKNCNRPQFEKWYMSFKDYILNEYKDIDGFTILKNDLKPGMNLYLNELGLQVVLENYYQPNTLKKHMHI